MEVIKYPSAEDFDRAVEENEQLLVLISFDGKKAVLSQIDEAVEHHILLLKAGFSDRDIDKYFRFVLNDGEAEWAFVCPPDYRNISDRARRIKQFYADGYVIIPKVLKELGLNAEVTIPKRYRRHFDEMMSW